MLKVNGSRRLPSSRSNIHKHSNISTTTLNENGPMIISCRSLRSSESTSSSSSNSSDRYYNTTDEHDSQVEYNPIDLSVTCSSSNTASSTSSQTNLSANAKMSLLPQIWHLCDLCDESFSSKFALMDHFRRIHRVQRMSRRETLPDMEIIPINNVSQNQRSLANDIIYHPPGVTIRRMNNNSINSQQQQQHSSLLFSQFELMSEICRVCSASFSDKKSLMSHMKSVHPMESRFGCSICSKILSSRAALIGHMRIHTGEKPHICSTCNRAFSNSQTLTRHFRTHTKEKPYECHICGKRASLRHNMKLHIKIHEKQIMFSGHGQS